MGALIFAGLFCTAIGLWLTIWGFRGLARSRREMAAARHWPEATAVVDSVGIHTTERRLLGLLFLLTRGRDVLLYLFTPGATRNTGANTYDPQVNYRFQVGGQTFHGNRLAFGQVSRNFIVEARKMIAPYQPGSWVKVRYNPHDPRESVIQAKVSGTYLPFAIFGPILLAMGLFLFIGMATGLITEENARRPASSSRSSR